MSSQKASNDEMKQMFKDADTDGSGCLSIEEMKILLQKGNRNITETQLNQVFAFFDSEGGDKKVAFDEFCRGLNEIEQFAINAKAAYEDCDVDKSGCLEKSELKKILQESDCKFTQAEIEEILKRADPNGDNKVSFEEFINAFT